MGIFYNPPPPPTASNAGTPPEPHAPIGTQGSQPPRYSTVLMLTAVLASWPQDLEPRLQRPNNQQNKIAPLTLVYGQQPAPIAPLATAEWSTIVASWQETWGAQRAPKSLAWNIPISPYLARTPPPSLIWDAWIPPPPLPARPVQIAPLTLAYGAQPKPQPPLSTLELTHIVGTWRETWDAQTAPEGAAWNVPPLVSGVTPRTPLPSLIWAAWAESFVRPPTLSGIAPLTLVYGDAPPVRGVLPIQAQIAATWAEPWIAQPATKSAAWNIPPIASAVVPYTPLPSLIWSAWTEAFVRPPTPVDIAPLTLTPPIVTSVPFMAPPYSILRAWQDDPVRLPRLVTIAPLTLVYGNQPPVQAPLSGPTRLALQAWPADLEPRLGRPNAERVRIAALTLIYGNPPAPHGPLSPAQLSVLKWAWEPPWHISKFFEHGNYVPGSFISLAPVRQTSARLINAISYEVASLEARHTADLIGETFTVERLPS